MVTLRYTTDGLQYCCGVTEVGSFGLNPAVGEKTIPSKLSAECIRLNSTRLYEALSDCIDREYDYEDDYDGEFESERSVVNKSGGHLFIATVTETQDKVKAILEDAGFEVVKEFVNSNTENTVFLMQLYISYT